MARLVGTVSRGIRLPIIKENDDLREAVVNAVLEASKDDDWGFKVRDKDIICITESVVARAQSNYVSTENITKDVKAKLGEETIGLVFPIMSRNRFAICLRGIAGAAKKIVIQMSYPADEKGNLLVDPDEVYKKGLDPYRDILDVPTFREYFGSPKHKFTGVDYIEYYTNLVNESGAECEIILGNDPREIMNHTDKILVCDIHTKETTKKILKDAGAKTVLGLDDIMTAPVDGSGYNPDYGLLGSNKATESSVKLFPCEAQGFVDGIQEDMKKLTGKDVEVMIYGDGCFHDPVCGIWEFADPEVAPFYTEGLKGTPNELKIKYLADNAFSEMKGDELKDAIKKEIEKKDADLVGNMASEGTTPRRLTDLIGSLCDLTSGSGDKGTPVVYIQGYFDNYTTE